MTKICEAHDLPALEESSLIKYEGGKLTVPDEPIIAFIEGDGIGPEVVSSAIRVVDAAVRKAYGGRRRIRWLELLAGEKAQEVCGERLPSVTVEALRVLRAGLKGPMTTPVGTGWRSVNVALRIALDLYANVRPTKWYGQPAPFVYADKLNVVVFRENTEDLYVGIEWQNDSPEAEELRDFLRKRFGINVRSDAGLGLKVISKFGTERIVRAALKWTLANGNKRVTIVHKGNVMKYTEGAFVRWAYEVILREFREYVVTEEELNTIYGGVLPQDKILVNDRITDNMLQQLITRPWDYEVLVTPNVAGDVITDMVAALEGGIGMAPGLNMGDGIAVAEPVHGSAPKYAGKDVANPTAAVLSASLLVGYFLGWREVNELVERAIRRAIAEKKVTQDLARHISGATALRTSEYTEQLIEYIESS
ncbi:MAG: NADP-dependent isocitrate dehydrogenase [Acidilobaceae archaeon]